MQTRRAARRPHADQRIGGKRNRAHTHNVRNYNTRAQNRFGRSTLADTCWPLALCQHSSELYARASELNLARLRRAARCQRLNIAAAVAGNAATLAAGARALCMYVCVRSCRKGKALKGELMHTHSERDSFSCANLGFWARSSVFVAQERALVTQSATVCVCVHARFCSGRASHTHTHTMRRSSELASCY